MKFMFILGYFGKSYPLTPGNLQLENLDNWVMPRVWSTHIPTGGPVTVATGPLLCKGVATAPCGPSALCWHFNEDKFTGDLPQMLSCWFIPISVWASWKALWRQDRCAREPWTSAEFRQVGRHALRGTMTSSHLRWQEPLLRDWCPPHSPTCRVTFLGKRWMASLQPCHVLKTLPGQ